MTPEPIVHLLAYTSNSATLTTVTIEPRPGGRVFERHRDGAADGGCSLRFEHGGWNAGNADQRAKFRDWPLLLRRFAAFAER